MSTRVSLPRQIALCGLKLALITCLGSLCVPGPARAQSLWQQLKEQAKKTKEQMKQAAHPQQAPQQTPQPGQPNPQTPGRGGAQAATAGRDISGPIHPPQGTKVEETVLAPLADGAKFFISPHGVHVATVENSGSRAVVYYDGVPGPKFDEIFAEASNGPGGVQVVFSPDGKRYAYCGHLGNEFVVMVDGKELTRSSESNQGTFDGRSCQLGFTSNGQHVYYISLVSKSSSTGQTYYRFVFDGQSAPVSYSPTDPQMHPVFSPDGNHFAYVATDPADEHKWALVIDGKFAPYRGGDPQWSADSRHLYTILLTPVPGRGQVAEALLDGKPFLRADHIELYPAPLGNMVVAEVTTASNTNQPRKFLVVDGQKVPGTEVVTGRGAQLDQVTISPDGKHYAARFTNDDNRQYVFVDGKRGQDYQMVDHIAFTSGPAKVTYTAFANGKPYAIIGDQESNACLATLTGPVVDPHGFLMIAPNSGRAGTICGQTGGAATIYMDGKTLPLPDGAAGADDLRFSPDGQHYAYDAIFRGMVYRLVVDGAVQMNSSLATSSNPGGNYVFSPDSQHIAAYSLPPNPNGQYATGLFLDGKNIPIPTANSFFKIAFTADSKHIAWAQPVSGPQRIFRIFVDGKPVADAEEAIEGASREAWWDMTPDGSLEVLAQDDKNLKRITITPSPETNLAKLGGDGITVAGTGK